MPPFKEKPKTNADHIRAMTDEELAKWLEDVDCWNCECCLYMRECRLEYDEAKHDCTRGRTDWLKMPYKEDA
jgi:hypothetical protein